MHIYPLKLYLKHKPCLIMIILGLLANLATWTWLFWQLGPLREEQIFLHYNILFGVDYVGPFFRVFLIPLISLGIFLLNICVGWVVFSRDRFAAYLLLAVGIFVQLGVFVASGLLVFLNV